MRSIALRLMFVVGALLTAVLLFLPIFLFALFRRARAVHPHGTICRAEIVALDDVVGPRLAGEARVRLSGVTGAADSTSHTVFALATKFGTNQDLIVATFEAFTQVSEGTKNTNVADYTQNQFSSVTPWRVAGLGIVWFRAHAHPDANVTKTGARLERLDADIAARRAKFVLEAHDAPGPSGPLRTAIAEIHLVERLPGDDPHFAISMFRTGRGLVPTGFRNGIRAVAYPASQIARHLRGA